MNRETKIGLITGLAIIVMVGMLLSSYLNRQSSSIKVAGLKNLGSSLRNDLLHPISDQTIPMPNIAPPGAPTGRNTTAAQMHPQSSTTLTAYTPETSNSASIVSMPGYSSSPVIPFSGAGATAPPNTTLNTTLQVQNAVLSHAPAPTNGGTTYTVAANDTLTSIAQRFYHVSGPLAIERIIHANPQKLANASSMLQIGEQLIIPATNNREPMTQMMAVTSSGVTHGRNATAVRTYIVKSGDTLYRIAAVTMGAATMHNINALKQANHITNDRDLRVGEKLNVP